MEHKQYDKGGQEVTSNKDLQNKVSWCAKGEEKELSFLKEYGDILGLSLNPEKLQNPLAHDFVWTGKTGKQLPADLKTQNTPFFLSGRYNVPPQTAVTFNHKDLLNYTTKFPSGEFLIYYSVNWLTTRMVFKNGHEKTVKPMKGIWGIYLKDLVPLCRPENLHPYQQRQNDEDGNAKDSYVLDLTLNAFKEIKI